jgi:hypothetical protein
VAERSEAGWGILNATISRASRFTPPDRLTSFGGRPPLRGGITPCLPQHFRPRAIALLTRARGAHRACGSFADQPNGNCSIRGDHLICDVGYAFHFLGQRDQSLALGLRSHEAPQMNDPVLHGDVAAAETGPFLAS